MSAGRTADGRKVGFSQLLGLIKGRRSQQHADPRRSNAARDTEPSAANREEAVDDFLAAWRRARRSLELLQCPVGNVGESSPGADLKSELSKLLKLLVAELRGYSSEHGAPPCHQRLLDSDIMAHLCRFAKSDLPHSREYVRFVLHAVADIVLFCGEVILGHGRQVVEPLLDMLQHYEHRRDTDVRIAHGVAQLLYALSWQLAQSGMEGHSCLFFVEAARSPRQKPLSAPFSPPASPATASASPATCLSPSSSGQASMATPPPAPAQTTTMGVRGGGRKVIRAVGVTSPSMSPRFRTPAPSSPLLTPTKSCVDDGRFLLCDLAAQGLRPAGCGDTVRAGDVDYGHLTAAEQSRELHVTDVAFDSLACLLSLRCPQVMRHVEQDADTLSAACSAGLADALAAVLCAETVQSASECAGRLIPRLRVLETLFWHPSPKLRQAAAPVFESAVLAPLRRALADADTSTLLQFNLLGLVAGRLRAPAFRVAVCELACEPAVRNRLLESAAADDDAVAASAMRAIAAVLTGHPELGYSAFVGTEQLSATGYADLVRETSVDALVPAELRKGAETLAAAGRDASAAQLRAAMYAAGAAAGGSVSQRIIAAPRQPPVSVQTVRSAADADPPPAPGLLASVVARFASLLRQPLDLNVPLVSVVTALLRLDVPPLTRLLAAKQDAPPPGSLPEALVRVQRQIECTQQAMGADEFLHQLRACRQELGIHCEAESRGHTIQGQARRGPMRQRADGREHQQSEWRPAKEDRRFFEACCLLEEWRKECAATLQAAQRARLVNAMKAASVGGATVAVSRRGSAATLTRGLSTDSVPRFSVPSEG